MSQVSTVKTVTIEEGKYYYRVQSTVKTSVAICCNEDYEKDIVADYFPSNHARTAFCESLKSLTFTNFKDFDLSIMNMGLKIEYYDVMTDEFDPYSYFAICLICFCFNICDIYVCRIRIKDDIKVTKFKLVKV